jgi:hypothetical protein
MALQKVDLPKIHPVLPRMEPDVCDEAGKFPLGWHPM